MADAQAIAGQAVAMGQAAVGAIPESWVAFTQKDDFW